MSCINCGCPPVNNPCPGGYPDSQCIVYTGQTLPCIGVTVNDRLNTILKKINDRMCIVGGGTILTFTNGLTLTDVTVTLGGTLIQDTSIDFSTFNLSLLNVNSGEFSSSLGLDVNNNIVSGFPTWQNTLSVTNGNVLTQDNTVDGGGFNFTITNASDIILNASLVTLPSLLNGSATNTFLTTDNIGNLILAQPVVDTGGTGPSGHVTWQDSLIASSLLKQDNSVDGGAFSFDWGNNASWSIFGGTATATNQTGPYTNISANDNTVYLYSQADDTIGSQVFVTNNAAQLESWNASGDTSYVYVNGNGGIAQNGTVSISSTSPLVAIYTSDLLIPHVANGQPTNQFLTTDVTGNVILAEPQFSVLNTQFLTWQQTLINGSTLTQNNIIDGGGFDFDWGNGGYFSLFGGGASFNNQTGNYGQIFADFQSAYLFTQTNNQLQWAETFIQPTSAQIESADDNAGHSSHIYANANGTIDAFSDVSATVNSPLITLTQYPNSDAGAFLTTDGSGNLTLKDVPASITTAVIASASTTAPLPASTYNNGSGGVGATLTENANGALPAQDGVTLVVNDVLLVKDQAAQLQNGVYRVTQVGDGSNPFILTRATGADQTGELYPEGVTVTAGTINANFLFIQQTAAPTVGTDPIIYGKLTNLNLSLAAIGSSPNANAATLSSNVLNLQPASASFGGVVNTTVQSFAGQKTFVPTITASGGEGNGTIFTPTLNAAANNDRLEGLKINPTFNHGSFTGVNDYAIRHNGSINPLTTNTWGLGGPVFYYLSTYTTTCFTDNVQMLNSDLTFLNVAGTAMGKCYNTTTGNWTLQAGGSFTDNGYKLDVIGNAATGGLKVSSYMPNGHPHVVFAEVTIPGNGVTSAPVSSVYYGSMYIPSGGATNATDFCNFYAATDTYDRGTSGANKIIGYKCNLNWRAGSDITGGITTGMYGFESLLNANWAFGPTNSIPQGYNFHGLAHATSIGKFTEAGHILLDSINASNLVSGVPFAIKQLGTTNLNYFEGTVTLGTTTPNASARLQIDSTTQGVLFPRMTTTQKNAISSPAEGLTVYDITLHKLCTWDGSVWQNAW